VTFGIGSAGGGPYHGAMVDSRGASRWSLVLVLTLAVGLLALVLWQLGRDGEGRGAPAAPPAPAESPLEPVGGPAAAATDAVPLETTESSRQALPVEAPPVAEAKPEPTEPSSDLVVIGRCVDPFGQPLADVAVTGFLSRTPVVSDAEGRFRWSVSLASAQGLPSLAMQFAHPDHGNKRVSVAATPGQQDLGDVMLGGGTLTGFVLDPEGRPLEGIQVVAHAHPLRDRSERFGPPTDTIRARTKSAHDGSFRLVGVPEGTGGLAAGGDRHHWTFGAPYEIRIGEVLSGHQLVLEPVPAEFFIELLLLDPEGEPARGKRVSFHERSPGGSVGGSLGVDDAGWVRVRLDSATSRVDFEAGDLFGPLGRVRALDVPGGTRDLVIRLERAEPIELTVRDPAGAPIESLQLEWRPLGEGGGMLQRWSREFPGGRVEFNPLDGPFELHVSSPGFRSATVGPLGPGVRQPPVELVLEPLPALTGRVFAAGEPLEGAEVQLLRAVVKGSFADDLPVRSLPQSLGNVTSDAQGHFRLPLPAEGGRFYVRASRGRLAPRDVGPLGDGARANTRRAARVPPGPGRQPGRHRAHAGGRVAGRFDGGRLPRGWFPAPHADRRTGQLPLRCAHAGSLPGGGARGRWAP
jgi:hypothetical protein